MTRQHYIIITDRHNEISKYAENGERASCHSPRDTQYYYLLVYLREGFDTKLLKGCVWTGLSGPRGASSQLYTCSTRKNKIITVFSQFVFVENDIIETDRVPNSLWNETRRKYNGTKKTDY